MQKRLASFDLCCCAAGLHVASTHAAALLIASQAEVSLWMAHLAGSFAMPGTQTAVEYDSFLLSSWLPHLLLGQPLLAGQDCDLRCDRAITYSRTL